MTENNDTQNLEAAAPPPPPPPPPAEPEQPKTRWRDRKVGVVTLTVSTIAALVIGGTFGTAAGGLVGYGVGHHDRPDRPGFIQQGGMPGGALPGQGQGQQQFQPPNGELPPGMVPNQSEDDSDGSSGSGSQS